MDNLTDTTKKDIDEWYEKYGKTTLEDRFYYFECCCLLDGKKPCVTEIQFEKYLKTKFQNLL